MAAGTPKCGNKNGFTLGSIVPREGSNREKCTAPRLFAAIPVSGPLRCNVLNKF
jgi:hypothetical protein